MHEQVPNQMLIHKSTISATIYRSIAAPTPPKLSSNAAPKQLKHRFTQPPRSYHAATTPSQCCCTQNTRRRHPVPTQPNAAVFSPHAVHTPPTRRLNAASKPLPPHAAPTPLYAAHAASTLVPTQPKRSSHSAPTPPPSSPNATTIPPQFSTHAAARSCIAPHSAPARLCSTIWKYETRLGDMGKIGPGGGVMRKD